jgi:hypothetical protein
LNRAPDRIEARKLEYEFVRRENIRLRDGRGELTRKLGPLPISAALVAGLVTGLSREVDADRYLWAALIVFGVLVFVSILYSGMKPYRVLRREHEARHPRSLESQARWYDDAIALEEAIYGDPARKGPLGYLPSFRVKSLQEGYDRERRGLFFVQLLFAAVIILLIVSRVT